MPLLPGKSNRAKNFDEFRHGKTFAHTAKKFGAAKARKQMIAAVLSNERGGKTIGDIHRDMTKGKK